MISTGDTLASLTTTCQSIVAKRGLGSDARILRVEPETWRKFVEEREREPWYWLSVLVDGAWCQIARRRDPRDLIGVCSTLTAKGIHALNFKEQK